MTTHPARIEGIVARTANVAVVFRRGPSRETRMLLWDLTTDEVTPGQWIRARVNVRNCDVTPDGRLLVAGIYDPGSRREGREIRWEDDEAGWTAISRPPYFSALALWFDDAGQGGHWAASRELHLFSLAAPDKGEVPKRFTRRALPSPGQGDPRPFEARLLRDGWNRTETVRHLRFPEDRRSDEEIVASLVAAGLAGDPPAPITLQRH